VRFLKIAVSGMVPASLCDLGAVQPSIPFG
jgi:hypothetical protein